MTSPIEAPKGQSSNATLNVAAVVQVPPTPVQQGMAHAPSAPAEPDMSKARGATGADFEVVPEIESLLPPLDDEQEAELRASLFDVGCRDPLVVGCIGSRRVLLDGHNRFRLCREDGLDFAIIELVFESIDDATGWVLRNQLQRRNLSPKAIAFYRGTLYNLDVERRASGRHQSDVDPAADRTGRTLGASYATVQRHGKYAKNIDLLTVAHGIDLRNRLLSREIDASFEQVDELAKLLPHQRAEIIERLLTKAEGVDLGKLLKARKAPAQAPSSSKPLGPTTTVGFGAESRSVLPMSHRSSMPVPGTATVLAPAAAPPAPHGMPPAASPAGASLQSAVPAAPSRVTSVASGGTTPTTVAAARGELERQVALGLELLCKAAALFDRIKLAYQSAGQPDVARYAQNITEVLPGLWRMFEESRTNGGGVPIAQRAPKGEEEPS